MKKLFGAIEAGGTKFICAVGTGPFNILEQTRIDTESPDKTLGACLDFFSTAASGTKKFDALGIGSFGPIDPVKKSNTWGYITSTPKPGWQNTDIAGFFIKNLGMPVGFDTDVNAAALGEGRWGAAKGLDDYIYITIGTGIGAGILVNGKLVHGLTHPEIGHFRPFHDLAKDPFKGICPFHGDCLEGLASGPAVEKRWGRPAEELPEDHQAWDLESDYLAVLAAQCIMFYSPARIIFGGGIMNMKHLFPLIREKTAALLGGYIQNSMIPEKLDQLIIPPGLGGLSGIAGTFILAEQASADF